MAWRILSRILSPINEMFMIAYERDGRRLSIAFRGFPLSVRKAISYPHFSGMQAFCNIYIFSTDFRYVAIECWCSGKPYALNSVALPGLWYRGEGGVCGTGSRKGGKGSVRFSYRRMTRQAFSMLLHSDLSPG